MLGDTELTTSCPCILCLCQHLCKKFPGEEGERRLQSADKLMGCF